MQYFTSVGNVLELSFSIHKHSYTVILNCMKSHFSVLLFLLSCYPHMPFGNFRRTWPLVQQ